MMTVALFEPIKTMARLSRRVIVSYSGGKDSAVVLDLCCRYFDKVFVFHMHFVKGLSFQTSLIRWAEKRYGVEIVSLPHFVLSDLLRYGSFREPDLSVPIVQPAEVYNYVRERFKTWWIAGGERIKDSIWRRAMMVRTGSIDEKRGRFFPAAYWSKPEIEHYIKTRKLKVAPESRVLGHSFRGLSARDMWIIKKHYPADFKRIKSWFPLCEAAVKNYADQTPEI